MTRAFAPTLEDLIFNFLSLDYHHTLQAASGAAAEAARTETMRRDAGRYLLIVEGSVPTAADGVYSAIAGQSNLDMLRETAAGAAAIIALGSCAAFGGIASARPNPTGAMGVGEMMETGLIGKRPLVNLPGCPPMPLAIAGTLAYFLAFDALPPLDDKGRPLAFYGASVHEQCYRYHFFVEGKFAKSLDDEGARAGWCLYELGCKGPVTHNACARYRWNGGVSFPVESGHPCIGCSEPGFWDAGGFIRRSPRKRSPRPRRRQAARKEAGRVLFEDNCLYCHAADPAALRTEPEAVAALLPMAASAPTIASRSARPSLPIWRATSKPRQKRHDAPSRSRRLAALLVFLAQALPAAAGEARALPVRCNRPRTGRAAGGLSPFTTSIATAICRATNTGCSRNISCAGRRAPGGRAAGACPCPSTSSTRTRTRIFGSRNDRGVARAWRQRKPAPAGKYDFRPSLGIWPPGPVSPSWRSSACQSASSSTLPTTHPPSSTTIGWRLRRRISMSWRTGVAGVALGQSSAGAAVAGAMTSTARSTLSGFKGDEVLDIGVAGLSTISCGVPSWMMRPPSMMAMREPIFRASSRSWLTKTMVRASFLQVDELSCRWARGSTDRAQRTVRP
ncbi:MAG: hydrogenase small subunit [Hyphomicrobiales bacterium]